MQRHRTIAAALALLAAVAALSGLASPPASAQFPGIFNAALLAPSGCSTPGVTLNPSDKNSNVVLSNGNLSATGNGGVANHQMVRATIGISAGKFSWEWSWSGMGSGAGNNPINIPGLQDGTISTATGNIVGGPNTSIGWGYATGTGNGYATNFTTAGSFPALQNGVVYRMDYDATAGKAWARDNTGYLNSGNPSTGANPSWTRTGGNVPMFPAVSFSFASQGTITFNFGATPFTYSAQTGFCALGK